MTFCDVYAGNKLVAKKVKYCGTFISKLNGLMFVKSPGEGAFLPDVRDIHMNFVRFNLRVIWLDSDFRVVSSVIARKWRLYYGQKEARHVLELPVGNHSKLKRGQKLEIRINGKKDNDR